MDYFLCGLSDLIFTIERYIIYHYVYFTSNTLDITVCLNLLLINGPFSVDQSSYTYKFIIIN